MAGDEIIYVVVAPSGAGKSSLIFRLLQEHPQQVELAVSYTTREPRKGEEEGKHYYFTEAEVFTQMRDRGEFLEWAQVHEHYYGTAHSEVQRIAGLRKKMLLEIDIQGWLQVKALYPQARSLFILPPSIPEMQRRLESRASDTIRSLRKRWQSARKELAHVHECEAIMVNDSFDRTYEDFKAWLLQDQNVSANREQGLQLAQVLLAHVQKQHPFSVSLSDHEDQ